MSADLSDDAGDLAGRDVASLVEYVEWWVVFGTRTPATEEEGPKFTTYYVAGTEHAVCREPVRLFRPGRILDPQLTGATYAGYGTTNASAPCLFSCT